MTEFDDDDENRLRRDRRWEGVAILRGGGRPSIFISFRFHSCTIISHIITIHIFFFYCRLTTDLDDDDDDSLRRDRLWEGVAILRGAGRSTVSISFQFYSCTIISHIITIHFFFLYRQPMTDFDDYDDDDSL